MCCPYCLLDRVNSEMTFLGKQSADHELLADSSPRRDRLESGASLLHHVSFEYFMFSSTNVSEGKKQTVLCFRTI